MKRLITTFALAILPVTFTACVAQPMCSGEEMVRMKTAGFTQEAIKDLCTSVQIRP
jgi:hypothetical protein